jgi:hypothetical protein
MSHIDTAYQLLAVEFHEAARARHPDALLSWHPAVPQCSMVDVVAQLLAGEPEHRMLSAMLMALLVLADDGSTTAADALDDIAHEYASAFLHPLVRLGVFND